MAHARDMQGASTVDAGAQTIAKVETSNAESQTEIQLAHCLRSVTWIPMTDELRPMGDDGDDEYGDDGEEEEEPMHIKDEENTIEDVNGVDYMTTAGPEMESIPVNNVWMCALLIFLTQAKLVQDIDHSRGQNEIKSVESASTTEDSELEDFVTDSEDLENFELEDFETDSEDLENFELENFETDSENLENIELEDFDTDEEMQELVESSEEEFQDIEESQDFEDFEDDFLEIMGELDKISKRKGRLEENLKKSKNQRGNARRNAKKSK